MDSLHIGLANQTHTSILLFCPIGIYRNHHQYVDFIDKKKTRASKENSSDVEVDSLMTSDLEKSVEEHSITKSKRGIFSL